MDVGRDRADGGRPDGEGEEVDLEAALEDVSFDSEDESSDAVLEEFESASPEEIVDDADGQDDDHIEEATDEDVANLFGDLGAVELDPDDDPDPEPDPESRTAETGASTDGTDDTTEELPDPDEMADEVEGLLGDLGSVEVEAGADAGATAAGSGTPETQSTVLDTGETSGFQWLGEDVEIFSPGEGEAEEMFEGFDESSPEELFGGVESVPTPDVNATDLFDGVGAGEPPATRNGDAPATDAGWTADGDAEGTVDVRASGLFETLPGERPEVSTGSDAVDADETATEEVSLDDGLDLSADDPTEHLDLDLDDPTESTGSAEPTDRTGEPDPTESAGSTGSPASVDAAASTDSSPHDRSSAGSGADGKTDPVPTAADTDDDIETDLGDAAVAASGSVVGESDVDAVFERFEENTPEEIIESAADPAAESPDADAGEPVEELFDDLGTVDLEREAPTDRDSGQTAPAPGSEAAQHEVEGLLGDLSTVDLDAEFETEAAATAPETRPDTPTGDEPDELERTGEDTHVAVGESDVDAVFGRFEESTPEEVLAASGIEATDDAEADPFSADADAAEATPFEDEDAATSTTDSDPDPAPEDDETDDGGGILSKIVGLVSGIFG